MLSMIMIVIVSFTFLQQYNRIKNNKSAIFKSDTSQYYISALFTHAFTSNLKTNSRPSCICDLTTPVQWPESQGTAYNSQTSLAPQTRQHEILNQYIYFFDLSSLRLNL